jgi:hypothetical protein
MLARCILLLAGCYQAAIKSLHKQIEGLNNVGALGRWLASPRECYSAWGPDADRHDKSLIHMTLEGHASVPIYT